MPWREVASASFLGCAGGCLRVADAEGRRADEGAADMSSLHVQCPGSGFASVQKGACWSGTGSGTVQGP